MKKTIINLIVLILFNIFLFLILKFKVIDILNTQNLYNINAGKNCLESLNPKNENELIKDADICLKYLRNNGKTGDMFIFRVKDKAIVWDASKDCKLSPKDSYLTKDKICSLFYDKKSCIKASNKFQKQTFGVSKWEFTPSYEYDYFDTIEVNKTKYRIISGGQFEEVFSKFYGIIAIVFIFDIITIILTIIGWKLWKRISFIFLF